MFDFIIEDGTGLENSTAYCDIAFVDDYADFLKDESWPLMNQDEKENAIIRATMFVDDMLQFQGNLLNSEQSLNWPRTEFVDANGRTITGLPKAIVNATAQLALASIEEDLNATDVVLTSRSWGGASESYLGGYVEEESRASVIKNMLTRLGYGRSSTSFVIASRA